MNLTSGDIIECAACGEEGEFEDEIFLYDLPIDDIEGGPTSFPFCLDCGPEENYENLAT